ncbi:hypothetical protein [Actinacidiphila oryziradicis]|uniref:hypothetical protein n=1 Tax=Actinacidiphila oryziradicis TaxID=2571141 RepID=UPI0023F3363E|nr:hypothetical protein [Actinacidiphila oryziradicis]MCW2873194.1 hypothetical protein [Actinacidiphila oryziradicis]
MRRKPGWFLGRERHYPDLAVRSALIKRARGVGAMEFVPEDLRDTSSVLGFLVPGRDGGGFGLGD